MIPDKEDTTLRGLLLDNLCNLPSSKERVKVTEYDDGTIEIQVYSSHNFYTTIVFKPDGSLEDIYLPLKVLKFDTPNTYTFKDLFMEQLKALTFDDIVNNPEEYYANHSEKDNMLELITGECTTIQFTFDDFGNLKHYI